jgi:hypothetical protein
MWFLVGTLAVWPNLIQAFVFAMAVRGAALAMSSHASLWFRCSRPLSALLVTLKLDGA